MQNAKDTFYITLRNRLAALNPERTVVIREATRPGTLVEENELVTAAIPTDAFIFNWIGTKVDSMSALPLVTMQCQIRYATDGTVGNGGMDRGRLLATMDAELATAVGSAPHNAAKLNYSGTTQGAAPTPMQTNIFWGDIVFGNAVTAGERLERAATVDVFSYQEAGEL
jgi:hypothetical protein